MRTTIDLPDSVLRQAKARAALEGLTLKELITSYVVQGLQQGAVQRAAQPRQRSAPPVIDESVTGEPIPALSADELAELGGQGGLEEQERSTAKAKDADAAAKTVADARAQYELESRSEQAQTTTGLLPQDLTESLMSAADQAGAPVDALIQEAIRQYLAARRREQIEREIAAYETMHATLLRELPGMWVAVHNGELVDHDHDKVELYRRVSERFGRKPVLLREVRAEATEEIWLRTPSTGRRSR